MPRIPPPDQVSAQYSSNRPREGSALSGNQADKLTSGIELGTAISREVERIEAKLWHNRLISYCKKKINRIIHPPPSIKIRNLVDDLTDNSPNQDLAKVLAALKLHTGRAIKLHQSDDGRLGFTDGKISISTKTLQAVAKSIKRNGVEMAYEYLRKGESLPAGYLQQILIPHIHRAILQAIRIENNSKVTVSQAKIQERIKYLVHPDKYIKDLLEKAGIKDEKSFTFERMLEFKKTVRNSIVKSVDEQASLTHQKTSTHGKAVNKNQDPIPRPELSIPGTTEHFVEKEDKIHIQKLASEDTFFAKIHLKDIGNRMKRTLLRNKRNHIFFIGGIIASIVITAVFPPAGVPIGIALVVSSIIEVGYELFWASGSSLWCRIRLIRGLRQIKKYADYDFTNLEPETDYKRKKLIKNLLYQCKYKTFTQIYNAYAELEKQAVKLNKMAAQEQKNLTESIAFQKEKALYHKRRKKLKSNEFLFDKLIEQVTISRLVIEHRNQKKLKLLWNEKFKEMNPEKRYQIFQKASETLVIQGHQIKIGSKNWLNSISPHQPIDQFLTTASHSPEPDLKKAEKPKLLTSLGTLKTLTKATFLRTVRKTIFNNLIDMVKILRKKATITMYDPFNPSPNLSGTSVFFAFFFLQMAADHLNARINKRKVNEIKNKRKGYTWQLTGKRKRTGREEVATLRSQAKEEIEPMIHHLFKSTKSMEKTGMILDDTIKRSKMQGKGLFGAMSDDVAATLFLRHKAWQQLLDQEINGTFSLFYKQIKEKTADWNHQIARTLVSKRQQATGVSAATDGQIHARMAHSGQGKKRSRVTQHPSEDFLRSIRNRVSGRLIQRFISGELSENKALREINSVQNMDELLALQFWINAASREERYLRHKDALRQFQQSINARIDSK